MQCVEGGGGISVIGGLWLQIAPSVNIEQCRPKDDRTFQKQRIE